MILHKHYVSFTISDLTAIMPLVNSFNSDKFMGHEPKTIKVQGYTMDKNQFTTDSVISVEFIEEKPYIGACVCSFNLFTDFVGEKPNITGQDNNHLTQEVY